MTSRKYFRSIASITFVLAMLVTAMSACTRTSDQQSTQPGSNQGTTSGQPGTVSSPLPNTMDGTTGMSDPSTSGNR